MKKLLPYLLLPALALGTLAAYADNHKNKETEKHEMKADTNNDGKVSASEVEVACYNCLVCNRGKKPCTCYLAGGCCACCDPLSNKLSKIFSEIFMRICCCGCSENQISYNSDESDKGGEQVNVEIA